MVFRHQQYGGILCDIGSHQIEQFLFYAGCRDAKVLSSKVGNYANPEYPELEDFGDATLVGDNGATNYFRVDWLTPGGLGTWGDGRTFILGTEGYIELRKYIDIARHPQGIICTWLTVRANSIWNFRESGLSVFGELILDCLERTEHAMSQEHAFKAGELCVIAQNEAVRIP